MITVYQCSVCHKPIEGDDDLDRHWDGSEQYHADCCPTCAEERW